MTLSDLSYYVRRFGPVAVVGFFVFIIFFLVMQALFSALFNRPVEVVYKPLFDTLEPINFSHTTEYPEQFSLTLDNIEGRPVTATDSAMVYFIPPTRTRFGYQQTIAFMAKAVGIDTESFNYGLNGTTATYTDGVRKLDIDITNYNFTFELDYGKTPSIFANTIIPGENEIREAAKSFLRQMNKLHPAIAQGQEHIIYLRYEPLINDFQVVSDPSQANVVEVDFFSPDIDSLPVVSPKYYNSSNFVTMVFHPTGNLIVKSQVKYFEKDFNTGGPYPLKTGDHAWDELLNRRGTIVLPSQGSTDIIVRDMFLGYYEPEIYQPYLLPVYVFLGDNGFAAYVSAVDETYFGNESDTAVPVK